MLHRDAGAPIQASGFNSGPVFRMHEFDPPLTAQLSRAEPQGLLPSRIHAAHVTVQVEYAEHVERQGKKLIQLVDRALPHLLRLYAFQGEGKVGGELVEESQI